MSPLKTSDSALAGDKVLADADTAKLCPPLATLIAKPDAVIRISVLSLSWSFRLGLCECMYVCVHVCVHVCVCMCVCVVLLAHCTTIFREPICIN